MVKPLDLQPNDRVGPYVIARKVGQGGMGAVFLAQHRHLGRKAAIKILLPHFSAHEDVLRRFFIEARATAAIRHPGIVEVFDCDVLPAGRAYLAMEFLEGETLRASLARMGRFFPDVASVTRITELIADALAAAHACGVVHRDLKPDNIFLVAQAPGVALREGPLVKIVDFGIAKLSAGSEVGTNQTQTGSIIGTPLYMSPEQCRGAKEVDQRSDVYSLGCIVFEMLVGRPPFVSDAPGDLLLAHMTTPAPVPSQLDPKIPPELDALVARLLAKAPEERFASMGEVAAAFGRPLQASVTLSETRIIPTPHTGRAAGESGALRVIPNTTFSEASGYVAAPTRRRRGLVIAAAVLGLGGGAAALLLAQRATPEAPPSAAPAVSEAPPPRELPMPAPPPRGPVSVDVHLASEPAGAEVWIEGESRPRGRTPLHLQLTKGGPAIEAVLRAAGRKPRSLTIDPTENARLSVQLEEAPPRPPEAAAFRPPKRPKRPRPEAPPAGASPRSGSGADEEPYKALGD